MVVKEAQLEPGKYLIKQSRYDRIFLLEIDEPCTLEELARELKTSYIEDIKPWRGHNDI